MATLTPFRALRPSPADAPRVASVPYDVVNTDEARALANGNPLSFLRVSRAEIELPAGTNPHADAVYDRAVQNFAALRRSSLVVEDESSVYLYRLRMGDHEQTGVAACWALDEYDRDVIKKHERTRRDKEDDRTRHMIAIGAQTGPVFLTYRATAPIDDAVRRLSASQPLFDFQAPDRVRHVYEDLPSYQLIDSNIAHGNPVIVRVRLGSGITHFVVIAGKDGFDYLVRDPGSGSAKGLYPLRELGSDIEALRFYEPIATAQSQFSAKR